MRVASGKRDKRRRIAVIMSEGIEKYVSYHAASQGLDIVGPSSDNVETPAQHCEL